MDKINIDAYLVTAITPTELIKFYELALVRISVKNVALSLTLKIMMIIILIMMMSL